MVRRIDNVGNTVWTAYFGDSHATAGKVSHSVGLSIVQVRIVFQSTKKKLILRAQSCTSNHKAWFRYPASLVGRFWEM